MKPTQFLQLVLISTNPHTHKLFKFKWSTCRNANALITFK